MINFFTMPKKRGFILFQPSSAMPESGASDTKTLMQLYSWSYKNNDQLLNNTQKSGVHSFPTFLCSGSDVIGSMKLTATRWSFHANFHLSNSYRIKFKFTIIVKKREKTFKSFYHQIIDWLRQILIGMERTLSWQGLNSGSLMVLTVTWWDKKPLVNSLDPNLHESGCQEQLGCWGTRLLITHFLPYTLIQQIWSPAKVIVYAKTDPSGKPAHGITAFIVEEHFPRFHKGNRHYS